MSDTMLLHWLEEISNTLHRIELVLRSTENMEGNVVKEISQYVIAESIGRGQFKAVQGPFASLEECKSQKGYLNTVILQTNLDGSVALPLYYWRVVGGGHTGWTELKTEEKEDIADG